MSAVPVAPLPTVDDGIAAGAASNCGADADDTVDLLSHTLFVKHRRARQRPVMMEGKRPDKIRLVCPI